MPSSPHRVYFERPGKPLCGAGLSTGVYGCSWFSFGFAVSFGFSLNLTVLANFNEELDREGIGLFRWQYEDEEASSREERDTLCRCNHKR